MKHDPEFCRRVAEAIGWTVGPGDRDPERYGAMVDAYYKDGVRVGWVEEIGFAEAFRPDVDWNDAMLAAELACRMGFAIHRASPDVPWRCLAGSEEVPETGRQRGVEVEHASGPRAICEAILKLKGTA